MSVEENFNEIKKSLDKLKKYSNYDVEKYSHSLMHQTGQLEYFYCNLVRNGESDTTYYRVHKKPHFHQLAYFNIGRGFPKEIMDGHWCYVLKDLGYKSLVIPCTSIKNNLPCSKYELDIKIKMNGMVTKSRIQLSDIRSIDNQRLDERKEFLEVLTASEEIIEYIKKILFE